MSQLTSAELPSETNTRVIVTLTVGTIDATKAGCLTHTLPTVTVPLTVAYLRVIGGEAVTQQNTLLIAFTLSSVKAWVTRTHATVENPLTLGALAAVGRGGLLAVAGAKRLHFHLQAALKAHRLQGEVTDP